MSNIGWWYLCRHGIGPGTIPSGVKIIATCEHDCAYKLYICLDRCLTTEELSRYDLKEECPSDKHIHDIKKY